MGASIVAAVAASVSAAAAVGGVIQSRKAAKEAQRSRDRQLKAQQAAAEAVKTREEVGTTPLQIQTTKTLGETEEVGARETVRKKRLGAAKLRIEPLQQTSTAASTGVSASAGPSLKV